MCAVHSASLTYTELIYTYTLTVFPLLVVSHQVFNFVELIVLVVVQGQDELLMMQSI